MTVQWLEKKLLAILVQRMLHLVARGLYAAWQVLLCLASGMNTTKIECLISQLEHDL